MPLLQSGDVPNFQEGGLGQAGSRASVPTLERSATPTVGAGTEPFEYRAYKGPSVNFSEGLGGFGAIALKLQKDVDNARVNEKLTLLKKYAIDRRQGENGFLKKLGIDALNADDDGNGLAEQEDIALVQYGESLQEDLTPNQRKLLQQKMVELRNQQYAFATQHVLQQNTTYLNGQNKAIHAENVTMAGASYNTPDVLDGLVQSTVEQCESFGERNGLSRDQINVMIRSKVGELYSAAVDGAIVDSDKDVSNLSYAEAILNERGSEMPAATAVSLRTKLNNVQGRIETYTAGKSIYDRLKRDNTGVGQTGIGRFFGGGSGSGGGKNFALLGGGPQGEGSALSWQINGGSEAQNYAGAMVFDMGLKARESAGRQFDSKGRPLEGRYADGSKQTNAEKVAYGVSQMTPETAKYMCEQLGWEYDENRLKNDKGYNQDLGRAYSGWLCQYYKGDMVKAIAAYGAGVGSVNLAVKSAKKAGKPEQWLDFLYVQEGNYRNKAGELTNPNHSKFDSRRDVLKAVDNFRKAAQGGMVDPQTNQVLDPLDPKSYHKVYRGFTRAEADAEAARLFPNNPLKQKQAADYAMQRQEQERRDFVQQQTQALGEALELIVEGKPVPNSVTSRLTPDQLLSVGKIQRQVSDADENAGDIGLFYTLKVNPGRLTSLSPEQYLLVRAQVPKSKRDQLDALYYGGRAEQGAATDATERYRGGQPTPTTKVSSGDTRTALEYALPPGQFKGYDKKTQDFLTGVAMEALDDYQKLHGGAEIKSSLERTNYLRGVFMQQYNVRGFGNFDVNRKKKPLVEITASDLENTNTGPTSAYQVLRELTKQRYMADYGQTIEPTSEQIRATFFSLMTKRSPNIDVSSLPLDSVTADWIREEYARKVRRNSAMKGNTDLPPIDLVRNYLLIGLSGESVPHETKKPQGGEDLFDSAVWTDDEDRTPGIVNEG